MDIKKELEEECNQRFNSVLLNKYRNGQDSIGWHSDNEKELGENPTILSLSLGSERVFKMRRYDKREFLAPFTEKVRKVQIFSLPHGSLLTMQGETQNVWQHAIDKQKDPELSLLSTNNYIERII